MNLAAELSYEIRVGDWIRHIGIKHDEPSEVKEIVIIWGDAVYFTDRYAMGVECHLVDLVMTREEYRKQKIAKLVR